MDFITEPMEIERKSMEIIESKLDTSTIPKENLNILKRVIHTTADFDYIENLIFSPNVVNIGIDAIVKGFPIVTDTNMAKAGINKRSLSLFSGEVFCYMSDEDVAKKAKNLGVTRAAISMEKAFEEIDKPMILAIGNAPTALIKIYELIREYGKKPALIIGSPVGFVNVVESKNLILELDTPYIIAKGQKGGSNVAAAISNGLIYEACAVAKKQRV